MSAWGSRKNYNKRTAAIEQKHIDHFADSITTIDKDSPEFLAIAAACTKPEDITVRHGMGAPLLYSEGRDCRYRYRKNTEKTTI